MKTYSVQIDDERVVQEIEETAKVAHVPPEFLIVGFIARAVAPQSKTAQNFDRELQLQP
jgi:hypothetical protein